MLYLNQERLRQLKQVFVSIKTSVFQENQIKFFFSYVIHDFLPAVEAHQATLFSNKIFSLNSVLQIVWFMVLF